ncbi:MAG: AGE family epimerase/isomerase [Candidatus Latescibacteria bacterium]|nr:AGE family epimerase/isomerase [Candidatus Latescibacterota bacterium]
MRKYITVKSPLQSHHTVTLPDEPLPVDTIAQKTLRELKENYRHRLFDLYLPFWDRGGYDEQRGGFMCYLNDDGTVYVDEKPLWFQARAIYIYSLLYNEFGQNPRFLGIAQKTRDFMVRYMKADSGLWYQRVSSSGMVLGDEYDDTTGEWFYGSIYVAEALGELFRAAHHEDDLAMMYETLDAALDAYDDPGYSGAWNYGGYPEDISFTGFRVQAHSMAIIGFLTGLLNHHSDERLDNLVAEHVDLVMNTYYNPELCIANENLHHDYSRIEGYEDYMSPGHSVETLWMILFEAIRTKDTGLFIEAANRFRRYLELGWDYGFEGFGDLHYWVFDGPDRTREKLYETKSMWSHTELLIGLFHIYEYTGEIWAKEWYERVRKYALQAFDTDYGVWRQAVDRYGIDKKRKIYSSKRKGNYHYPRYLIHNLLSIDRMIKNGGKTTIFLQ